MDAGDSEENPGVSAIVPCRNEARHVERFLADLAPWGHDGFPFEVIVADGRSDDGTREILDQFARSHAWLRVIDNPARFIPNGLNRAAAEASHEIVLRLDVHTRYDRDYARVSREVLLASGAQNVGGPWRAVGDTIQGRVIADVFQHPKVFGAAQSRNVAHEGPVDTVYLGCWWRDYLVSIGGFDERCVHNEDNELNRRIRSLGGTVWQSPRIRSEYDVPVEVRKYAWQWAQNGYWGAHTISIHRDGVSSRHRFSMALLTALLLLAVAGLFVTPVRWGLLSVGASYLAFALFVGASLARVRSWWMWPLYVWVVVATHVFWAAGFGAGLVDFLLLGDRGMFRNTFARLIR